MDLLVVFNSAAGSLIFCFKISDDVGVLLASNDEAFVVIGGILDFFSVKLSDDSPSFFGEFEKSAFSSLFLDSLASSLLVDFS